ncbi:lasso peptide biosynthesis B2 protein [Jeotgalibacillus aurantiacus]|uniref:lasso peptide biosynthesis B2 protein n=1 Tax=Jeotgalibacillus aurantiacus TaxID=2763266 RepID=UPI001D09E0ED|nr:lasso peptide biosynthesis B2 protein [Jeotgalibacillus aurantiacus]
MIARLQLFREMDPQFKWMLGEAYIQLAYGRLFKALPFEKASLKLGERMKETSHELKDQDRQTLAAVSQAVQIMSRYTPWESMCLVQAVAAMNMLSRRDIPSTLYLGTGKDESGKLAAHAWLRSGPFIITGAKGRSRYTVVGMFAKELPDLRKRSRVR